MKLSYHPVFMEYSGLDPLLERSLVKAFRVRDDDGNWVEFIDPDQSWIPTGLFPVVEGWAASKQIEIEWEGWPEFPKLEVRRDVVPGISLYDYQLQAAQAAVDSGRGVLGLATGAGKSELIIAVTLTLGTPKTLIVCPDVGSMRNMANRYRSRGFASVGEMGSGSFDYGHQVVCAVINSVYGGIKKGDHDLIEYLSSVDLFVADECHHKGTAYSWQVVGASCHAKYRFGLSGTPYKSRMSGSQAGTLHQHDSWLQAYTGPSLVSISPSVLQEQGFLSPCEYISFPSGGMSFRSSDWAEIERRGIIFNSERNERIVTLVENLVALGRYPLVSISKLRHGRILQRLLWARGVPTLCAYGDDVLIVPDSLVECLDVEWSEPVKGDPGYSRIPEDSEFLSAFLDHRVGALIGSSRFDESENIPFLTDLVNASGGNAKKSSQRWRQKIGRVLRLSPETGKTIARVWDPRDTTVRALVYQSRSRQRVVREEGYEVASSSFLTEFRLRDLPVFRDRS